MFFLFGDHGPPPPTPCIFYTPHRFYSTRNLCAKRKGDPHTPKPTHTHNQSRQQRALMEPALVLADVRLPRQRLLRYMLIIYATKHDGPGKFPRHYTGEQTHTHMCIM